MSTLGLIALVLAAAVVGGLVMLRRRRISAAPSRPKTVADLVRLRAESMPAPVAASVHPGSTDAGAVQVAVLPDSARPAEARVGAVQVAVLPDSARPAEARVAVPEPRATGTAHPKVGSGSPTSTTTVEEPEAPTPPGGVPLPAQRPPEPSLELELTVDDTPWGRAARMVAVGDGPGSWQAPASVEIVPLRLVPSQGPSSGSPGEEQNDFAGWADWADVDAEEDARAVPPPSAPDLGFGASGLSTGASAGAAESDPTVRGGSAAGAGRLGSAAEVATARPAAAPAVDTADATATAEQRVAGGEPAAAAPNADQVGVAESPAAGSVATAPLASVPAVSMPTPPADRERDPAVRRATTPAPAGSSVAAAPFNPVPAVSMPTRPADRERDPAVARAITPEPEGSSAAAAPSRGRPSSVDRAAEQDAADLALLRTFGFVDPSLRPDSAPVVSLVSPDGPALEPRGGGAPQPVRYQAVRRGGAPAGHVAVALLDDRGRAVAGGTAGSDGRGEVLAPASGSFVLVCTAPGYQPGAVALTVAEAPIEAEVLLTRSGSLAGSVHGEDGPIKGARVTLVQDGEIVDSGDTDHDGGYRIEDIGGGEYGLSVVAAGCEPIAILLDVPDEADLRHDVDLEPASVQAGYDRTDDDVVIGQL
jgi:hypothetical protein